MRGQDAVSLLKESIQAKVDGTPDDYFLPKRCIFKVPTTIRDTNEHAFTPLVVSIGPYHFTDHKFCSMESYKLTYLKSFLLHTKDNANLESYLNIVLSNRSSIDDFYVQPGRTPSYTQDFIQMVLVDAVFILELFRRYSDPSQVKDDLILGSVTITQVLRDILLVENQLPYFLLTELYSTAFGKQQSTAGQSLTDLACKVLGVSRNNLRIHSVSNEALCCHLLDLFRSRYQPSDENATKNISAYDHVMSVTRTRHIVSPTASKLFEAGVKFQVAANASSNLLDISFDEENETLTIPKLTMVQDPDWSLFRNMMVFEECSYPFNTGTYFMDYCYFLDCLIKMPEDVQVLVNAGIVENFSVTCEVLCKMFGNIRAKIDCTTTSWSFYYARLAKMLASCGDKSKNHVKEIAAIEVV